MTERQANLLIVDDEPLNLEIIQDYLDEENLHIETAEDGAIALEMLQGNPEKYDVVLLDRMMPGMDGLDVLKIIRKHPVLKTIPVILQTAMTAAENIVEGVEAGAYYYLTKPFEEDMLLSVIHTALRDRMQFLGLQRLVKENKHSMGLMKKAHFQFSTLDNVKVLSSLIANTCPDSETVVTGLSELMINAVEHGNLEISYQEKTSLLAESDWDKEIDRRIVDSRYKDRKADVHFSRSADEITITIEDQGEGFDWKKYIEFDSERILHSHGRGIAMANKFSFTSVKYNEKGNQVTVTIKTDS